MLSDLRGGCTGNHLLFTLTCWDSGSDRCAGTPSIVVCGDEGPEVDDGVVVAEQDRETNPEHVDWVAPKVTDNLDELGAEDEDAPANHRPEEVELVADESLVENEDHHGVPKKCKLLVLRDVDSVQAPGVSITPVAGCSHYIVVAFP